MGARDCVFGLRAAFSPGTAAGHKPDALPDGRGLWPEREHQQPCGSARGGGLAHIQLGQYDRRRTTFLFHTWRTVLMKPANLIPSFGILLACGGPELAPANSPGMTRPTA